MVRWSFHCRQQCEALGLCPVDCSCLPRSVPVALLKSKPVEEMPGPEGQKFTKFYYGGEHNFPGFASLGERGTPAWSVLVFLFSRELRTA